jgi:maltooligosyltrehalose trehalohydrolase
MLNFTEEQLRREETARAGDACQKFARSVGAKCQSGRSWEFTLWAPNDKRVSLHLSDPADWATGKPSAMSHHPSSERDVPMEPSGFGYFRATVGDLPPNCRYMYRLAGSENGKSPRAERPDPASRFQPQGVHGPSQIIDLRNFVWTDHGWKPPTLERSIFYELHVGTYTSAGTLDALVERLPHLVDLGVTTVELMPVAQFPGARNWGYDGVFPYAVHNLYGGPRALQRFVNAAHGQGLAVALDVVYNHLGPDGNYLSDFGPYFTDRYKTPWGKAVNFDGAQSEAVRRFFIDNAIYWFENYHIDVLRLDAIHGIFDFGALHFLAELQERVEEAGKQLCRELILVAESDLNDPKVLQPRHQGGYGIRSQWSDDFHHSLHALLTKEAQGYYADFGSVSDLAAVLRHGWLFQGQYSRFRKRRHGGPAVGIPYSRFVVCSQNHDQVGNRACGERLSQLVSFEAQKLAAGVTLLSPFVPLLFMGEEYGETSPFLYFTDHSDKDLIEAVRRGRRGEFVEFGWQSDVPDPQDPRTFEKSRLCDTDEEPHRTLRRFYQALLRFRKDNKLGEHADWQVTEDEKRNTLRLVRADDLKATAMLFNFGRGVSETTPGDSSKGHWTVVFRSSASEWLGPDANSPSRFSGHGSINLSPQSFAVLQRDDGDRGL